MLQGYDKRRSDNDRHQSNYPRAFRGTSLHEMERKLKFSRTSLRNLAEHILSMEVKVPSKMVDEIRNYARGVL